LTIIALTVFKGHLKILQWDLWRVGEHRAKK